MTPGTPIGELSYRYAGEDPDLDDYFEGSRASGLLVIKDGRIVLERYARHLSTRLGPPPQGRNLEGALIGLRAAVARPVRRILGVPGVALVWANRPLCREPSPEENAVASEWKLYSVRTTAKLGTSSAS